MSLDFATAQLPAMLPLGASFAENDVEADLKRLLMDLFAQHMAGRVFDANVLGAAHLGSFDLVRKAINADGLILLQGDREEVATRYLYRAWKSGDGQGRGLHFLRTYLQLLFPGECTVAQKWHTENNYPDFLCDPTPGFSSDYNYLGDEGLEVDGSWNVGAQYYRHDPFMPSDSINLDGLYLTSRIEITMGPSVDAATTSKISGIIGNFLPARLVTQFIFWRDRVLSEPNDIDRWYLGEGAGNLGDRVLVAVF